VVNNVARVQEKSAMQFLIPNENKKGGGRGTGKARGEHFEYFLQATCGSAKENFKLI
jgi:hypothetical protein